MELNRINKAREFVSSVSNAMILETDSACELSSLASFAVPESASARNKKKKRGMKGFDKAVMEDPAAEDMEHSLTQEEIVGRLHGESLRLTEVNLLDDGQEPGVLFDQGEADSYRQEVLSDFEKDEIKAGNKADSKGTGGKTRVIMEFEDPEDTDQLRLKLGAERTRTFCYRPAAGLEEDVFVPVAQFRRLNTETEPGSAIP